MFIKLIFCKRVFKICQSTDILPQNNKGKIYSREEIKAGNIPNTSVATKQRRDTNV
jgi:hypothetical protein